MALANLPIGNGKNHHCAYYKTYKPYESSYREWPLRGVIFVSDRYSLHTFYTPRQQAIPFAIEIAPKRLPMDDAVFFSGANLEHLRHSLAQAKAGKIFQHELIDAND